MNEAAAVSRLREVVRRKHLALATEESYAHWLVQFCRFARTVPAELASEQKVERFLTRMALRDYAASTQNQAFNALLFWHQECLGQKLAGINSLRAKKPVLVRNAPSVEEVRRLLGAVRDVSGYPCRLVVHLLYGCGLRVSEPLNLRVRDVRLDDSRLVIRHAKGGKDRVVALPCSLAVSIKAQLVSARAVWERDRAEGLPVKLPNRVAQKYPAAAFSWQWAWLFPMAAPCRDPRSGAMVRYRLLETNIQRAMQRACRGLGLEIKPHELRHAYATHCLNRGENARAIQQAMGHASLETTMGYLHAEATGVRSPLETIGVNE